MAPSATSSAAGADALPRALARLASFLGLAALGQGLFILLRVVPHETPLLGGALAAGGAALLLVAPLPRFQRLPRAPLVAGGLGVALGVVAWNLARGEPFVAPKAALVGGGFALAAAGWRADRPRVATALAWGLPVVGAPLAVWGVQALTAATLAGRTPMEAFLEHGLIAPMSAALALLGYHPVVEGQVVTFDAQGGGRMRLLVGVACSGLQAMALFGGVALAYVVSQRPGWRAGAFWCGIGFAGVYAVNVVRLVCLALVGSAWGAPALEWTHANLGWLVFVAWSGFFAWAVVGRTPWRPGGADARGS